MQPLAFLTKMFRLILALKNGDKLVHVIVGFAIALVAGGLTALIVGPGLAGPVGFLTALAAAVFKEIYDQRHKEAHTPDPLDAIATVFGALIAFPLLRFIDLWTL